MRFRKHLTRNALIKAWKSAIEAWKQFLEKRKLLKEAWERKTSQISVKTITKTKGTLIYGIWGEFSMEIWELKAQANKRWAYFEALMNRKLAFKASN